MSLNTYYDTLKVHRHAPIEVIKAAYKSLAQKYHPDRNVGDPEATRLMIQINEAYEVLSNPVKRAAYDRWLTDQELNQKAARDKQQYQSSNMKHDAKAITIHIDGELLTIIKGFVISLITFPFKLISRLINAIKVFIDKKLRLFAQIFFVILAVGVIAAVIHIYEEKQARDYVYSQPVDTTTTVNEPAPVWTAPVEATEAQANVVETTEPLPLTGDTDTPDLQGVAPLQIKVSQGNHYLIKIEDAYSHVPLASFFIRSGETLNTKVPVGSYVIKYAYGQQWYGLDHFFGAGTAYAKADDVFNFTFTGNGYSGHTIELILQSDGNLETSNISPSQF